MFIFSLSVRDSPLPLSSSPAPTKTRWTSTPLARLSVPSEYLALCLSTRPLRLTKRRGREDTPVLCPALPCTPYSTRLRSPSAPAQTIHQNQMPCLRPNKRHHTQTLNCAVSSICPELVSVALCALHRLNRCPLSLSSWTETPQSACHRDTKGSKHKNNAPLQSVVTSAPFSYTLLLTGTKKLKGSSVQVCRLFLEQHHRSWSKIIYRYTINVKIRSVEGFMDHKICKCRFNFNLKLKKEKRVSCHFFFFLQKSQEAIIFIYFLVLCPVISRSQSIFLQIVLFH